MGSLLKTRGTVAVWVATALIVVGCSSAPEVNTDPIPATTEAAPATTEPAATTPTAAPTTAAPTTTTTEPDTTEADIREAVDQLMLLTSSGLNTGQPRNPDPALLERWLTGIQLDRSRDIIEEQLALGRYYEGEFNWRTEDITVTGTSATVIVCVSDDTIGFESNGTVFDPDGTFSIFEVTLLRVDDRWKTENFLRRNAGASDFMGV